MENQKCSVHDEKIREIETNMVEIKSEMNRRFDLLMIEVNKPILNDKQVGTLLLMTILYTIGVMLYLTPISAKGKTNEKDNLRQDREISKQRLVSEEIKELLLDIKETVDKNEGAKEVQNKYHSQ